MMREPRGGRRLSDGSSLFCRAPLADERGVAAVEFALIAPIMILLLAGIVQFGAAFALKSEMLSVAREAARRLAVGNLTPTATSAWVAGQMPERSGSLSVSVTSPGTDNDLYQVTLSVPLVSVTGVDPFGLFENRTLSVAVSMRDEAGAS